MNSITALILFYKRQLGTRGLNIAICGMRYCRMVIMYGYLEKRAISKACKQSNTLKEVLQTGEAFPSVIRTRPFYVSKCFVQ